MRLRPSVEIPSVSEKNTNNKKGLTWRFLREKTCAHQHQADRASDTRCVCYVQQITSRNRLFAFEAIRCRYCDCCPRATAISYRAWSKGEKKAKDRRQTKKLTCSAIEKMSHIWGRGDLQAEEKATLRSSAVA